MDVAKYIDKRIHMLKRNRARTPLDRVDSQELRLLQNVDHQIDLALERKKIRDDDDCAYFCETGEHRYSYFADVYPCQCELQPLPSEITMPETDEAEVTGGNKKRKRKSNRRRRKQSSKSRKTRKNTRRKQKAGSKKRVKYNKTRKTRKTNKTKKNKKLRK